MRQIIITLTVVVLLGAGPSRHWKTARLVETHRQEGEAKTGKVTSVQFYTLDAGDRLIVCGHEFSMHPLDAEVGATLDYAPLPKSRIIIL